MMTSAAPARRCPAGQGQKLGPQAYLRVDADFYLCNVRSGASSFSAWVDGHDLLPVYRPPASATIAHFQT